MRRASSPIRSRRSRHATRKAQPTRVATGETSPAGLVRRESARGSRGRPLWGVARRARDRVLASSSYPVSIPTRNARDSAYSRPAWTNRPESMDRDRSVWRGGRDSNPQHARADHRLFGILADPSACQPWAPGGRRAHAPPVNRQTGVGPPWPLPAMPLMASSRRALPSGPLPSPSPPRRVRRPRVRREPRTT